jgi:hypothetical protein
MIWAYPSRYRRPQRGPVAAMMAAQAHRSERLAGMRRADCEDMAIVETGLVARNGVSLRARSARS